MKLGITLERHDVLKMCVLKPPRYFSESSYSSMTLTRVTDFGDGSTVTSSEGRIELLTCGDVMKMEIRARLLKKIVLYNSVIQNINNEIVELTNLQW